MQQLHKNYMSTDSTTKLARDYFHLAKISEDIYNFVDKCDPCNSTKPNNQKEPMIMLPIPEHPWQILSTDVFKWNNKLYSVLADWYSDMSSVTIISVLKVHFATHGVLENLFSDNARYYISTRFQNFSKTWNF